MDVSVPNSPPEKKPSTRRTSGKRPSAPSRDDRPVEPWKAGYYTSIKTQKRIKRAAESTSRSSVDRAVAVLQTFLSTPPERCNAANVVCALTLSAKVLGRGSSSELRALLFQTIAVLGQLKDDLSARQVANAAWAIAKHYDRDHRLLPSSPDVAALSSGDVVGTAQRWKLGGDSESSQTEMVDRVVDELALTLARMLNENPYASKEGELCMACWAYGILRPRSRPPGWRVEPQIAELRSSETEKQQLDSFDYMRYEQWSQMISDDPSFTPADDLFEAVAYAFCGRMKLAHRISLCRWNELANIAWAFATRGFSSTKLAERLYRAIADEASARVRGQGQSAILSRDIAQIVWALGTVQADNYRISNGLVSLIDAFAGSLNATRFSDNKFGTWSCPDIVQISLSLAHARLDCGDILRPLYEESLQRLMDHNEGSDNAQHRPFYAWEVSILLWAQARLYLRGQEGPVYADFTQRAIDRLVVDSQNTSLQSVGIGPQEQANIAWSLTVLQAEGREGAETLLRKIFGEAVATCRRDGVIQLEHAHQLWQALYLLEDTCPEAVADVPDWFREYLEDRWIAEKEKNKVSSSRHRSISQLLTLMGVAHFNEHDEDIDVALVLKPNATWTHQSQDGEQAIASKKVAVEFDGPMHFSRMRDPADGVRPKAPRALGHTALKYRLLKKKGWSVIRVPYYEYDRIPFWASMERQRYLQRLLKTHADIKFSSIDVSEYKAPVPNRSSRYD